MLNQDNTEKCRKVLDRNGVVLQTMKVAEECTELSQAALKLAEEPLLQGYSPERIETNQENFKEELVDVIIMTTQAVMMCGISETEINHRAQQKLDNVLGG